MLILVPIRFSPFEVHIKGCSRGLSGWSFAVPFNHELASLTVYFALLGRDKLSCYAFSNFIVSNVNAKN